MTLSIEPIIILLLSRSRIASLIAFSYEVELPSNDSIASYQTGLAEAIEFVNIISNRYFFPSFQTSIDNELYFKSLYLLRIVWHNESPSFWNRLINVFLLTAGYNLDGVSSEFFCPRNCCINHIIKIFWNCFLHWNIRFSNKVFMIMLKLAIYR